MDNLFNTNVMLIEHLELTERNVDTYRILRNPRNPFLSMNDDAFLKTFRLPKELVTYLSDVLETYMTPQRRATDLDVKIKVLVALNFFATGSHQCSVGLNKYLDVPQPSVSRCIKEVSNVLNEPEVLNEWIHMPSNLQELDADRLQFYERYGFPGVVGCIDCTYVAIVTPKGNNPEYSQHLYVNRKNYHSINVQLVCDVDLRVMNVCAKYLGSTNDAFIWNQSGRCTKIFQAFTRPSIQRLLPPTYRGFRKSTTDMVAITP